ncbi:type II toxin-antitoxin system RelE/ParE family toxin [Mesorhizobium sp. YR577]|uniref:type II toxin-antitoxin system RelE/ParE family toxin n=1 Tax=Mesorhizobium sp. YR577 TaxID=1884373 RepID=UPI0008E87B8A|nr:type II toxin-antitoxin system RelE/ParE family toxin [Mesorhizobium sp. YR577]SFU02666.1 toxin ParE1/3/4 [Mesorhizobium sp. YR577]
MTYLPVRKSARAEEDLIDIWLYVAANNEAAADRLLDRFQARWELLATQPYSGMERTDIAASIRHLVMGEYLTFYRIAADHIEILRVLHGKRDITADDLEA